MIWTVDSAGLEGALKIGFIADTHDEHNGFMKKAVALMSQNKPLDYLFHLGDFLNNFAERSGTGDTLYVPYKTAARRFKEIGKEFGVKKIGILPGNHDIKHPEEDLCELEEFSIHKKIVNIGGYNFLGYGGGFNFAQVNGLDRFDDKRYKCHSDELSELLEKNDVDVLLLHQLETKSRKKSLRKVIENSEVKIVISGHTHSHGVEFYGRPMYASCGPILPLDERSHQPKNMGKSSYGLLEMKGDVARMRLFLFGKDSETGGYLSELNAGMKINFRHY